MKDQENTEPLNIAKTKPALIQRVSTSELRIDTSFPDDLAEDQKQDTSQVTVSAK
jgi:hypothetical protein